MPLKCSNPSTNDRLRDLYLFSTVTSGSTQLGTGPDKTREIIFTADEDATSFKLFLSFFLSLFHFPLL